MLVQQNRKLRDEVNAVKSALNEMSLVVNKMAETQAMIAAKILNEDNEETE